MGLLKIDALGTSFTIKTGEAEAYLKKHLKYYKQITEQIEKNGSLSSNTQISILAGIMLCDELYKEKSKKASESKAKQKEDETLAKIEETLDRISARLDDALGKKSSRKSDAQTENMD